MKSLAINEYKKQFLIAVKNNLTYNDKYIIFIKPNIRCRNRSFFISIYYYGSNYHGIALNFFLLYFILGYIYL